MRVLATLLAVSASDSTSGADPELGTSPFSRRIQDSAEATSLALSSYACAANDRVVIEVAAATEELELEDDWPEEALP